MEKFLENLEETGRILKAADHITYVTFQVVQDKKLLLKLLEEIKNALVKNINAMLQYEYLYKKIQLSANPKTNFETFKNKTSKRFSITEEEIEAIQKIFNLSAKHKQSSMEIAKKEKVVILSENMQSQTLTLNDIKQFLTTAKGILEKTQKAIIQKT